MIYYSSRFSMRLRYVLDKALRLLIPIEKVKFPDTKGSNGNRPTPASNTIRIQGASCSTDGCVVIDWMSLEIGCTSPVVLVHGNSTNGTWWWQHEFIDGLNNGETAFLESDYRITFPGQPELPETEPVTGQASIANNSTVVINNTSKIAAEYGVDSVHFVCHSKGGLDTRAALKNLLGAGSTIEVLSMTTLSTPHDESVLADVMQLAHNAAFAEGIHEHSISVNWPDWDFTTRAMIYLADTNTGHFYLRQSKVAELNAVNIPFLAQRSRELGYFTINCIGADMDFGNDGEVNVSSEDHFHLELDDDRLRGGSAATTKSATQVVYNLLGETPALKVTREIRPIDSRGGPPTEIAILHVAAVPFWGFLRNDVLVTLQSARGTIAKLNRIPIAHTLMLDDGGTGPQYGNHSTVGKTNVATIVRQWILEEERRTGDLSNR